MKDLSALIEAAATRGNKPEYSKIFAYCEATKIKPEDFCNEFSLQVAKGFHEDKFTYEFCDEAMKYPYGFLTTPPVFGPDKNMPEPAFSIYEAFDEGEYIHQGDLPEENPAEKYTRLMIAEILSSIGAS